MYDTLSSKGQIVVPTAVRKRLGLLPGMRMRLEVKADQLVLTPQRPETPRFRHETSKISGLPVMEAVGEDAPTLTSEQVAELLRDFP